MDSYTPALRQVWMGAKLDKGSIPRSPFLSAVCNLLVKYSASVGICYSHREYHKISSVFLIFKISVCIGWKSKNFFSLLWTPWWCADISWKQGAPHAATRLLGLEEFKAANTVKINPDAPQKNARFLTLEVSECILFSFDSCLRTGVSSGLLLY